MALIVNITWFVKPEKRTQFVAELSGKLPVTRAYDGCHWLYLANNADSETDRVEAVSMWDSREKYDVQTFIESFENLKLTLLSNSFVEPQAMNLEEEEKEVERSSEEETVGEKVVTRWRSIMRMPLHSGRLRSSQATALC